MGDAVFVDPFVDDRAIVRGARVACYGRRDKGSEQRRENPEA